MTNVAKPAATEAKPAAEKKEEKKEGAKKEKQDAKPKQEQPKKDAKEPPSWSKCLKPLHFFDYYICLYYILQRSKTSTFRSLTSEWEKSSSVLSIPKPMRSMSRRSIWARRNPEMFAVVSLNTFL